MNLRGIYITLEKECDTCLRDIGSHLISETASHPRKHFFLLYLCENIKTRLHTNCLQSIPRAEAPYVA